MEPAVFLDRDGTINEDIGNLYRVEDISFIPGAVNALKRLQEKYQLFIITNQSGIGRKEFSIDDYLEFEKEYMSILFQSGVNIVETRCCPHTPEDLCKCRKPSTHFIEELAHEYNINLAKSYSVGDHLHDAEMGSKTGGKGIYVLTGHGKKHLDVLKCSDYQPDYIAKDLSEAVEFILEHVN